MGCSLCLGLHSDTIIVASICVCILYTWQLLPWLTGWLIVYFIVQYHVSLHCGLRNWTHAIFWNNFIIVWLVSIIFGRQNLLRVCNVRRCTLSILIKQLRLITAIILYCVSKVDPCLSVARYYNKSWNCLLFSHLLWKVLTQYVLHLFLQQMFKIHKTPTERYHLQSPAQQLSAVCQTRLHSDIAAFVLSKFFLKIIQSGSILSFLLQMLSPIC